jgi:HPt (histidine-containing phosphotransfer) domain-containing protein
MDAYLSKPMRANTLYATINQLVHHTAQDYPPKRESTPEPPVDVAAVLATVEGDRLLLAELLAVFADDYPKRLADIREAITMADGQCLEQAAHSLRGEVALFSAKIAENLAASLETMGGENRLGDALQVLQELERELERVAWFLDRVGWKTHVSNCLP